MSLLTNNPVCSESVLKRLPGFRSVDAEPNPGDVVASGDQRRRVDVIWTDHTARAQRSCHIVNISNLFVHQGSPQHQRPGSCWSQVHGEVVQPPAADSGGGGGTGQAAEKRQCHHS